MSPFPIGWSLSISERFVFSSAKLLFITSLNNICLMMVQPKYFVNKLPTQTKLLISAFQGPLAEKLYLSLFVCSFVRPAMETSDQISTFFNMYRHESLVLTQFFLIPSSISYTDPALPSTNQYCSILTHHCQILTSAVFY